MRMGQTQEAGQWQSRYRVRVGGPAVLMFGVVPAHACAWRVWCGPGPM